MNMDTNIAITAEDHTDAQRHNLRVLAHHLAYTKLEWEFNMRFYDDNLWPSNEERTTCGAIGCVIGSASRLMESKNLSESWGGYAGRVFGITGHLDQRHVWEWLFSSYWYYVDNTPLGAAKRITLFLDNGHSMPLDIEDRLRRIRFAPRFSNGSAENHIAKLLRCTSA